MRSAEGDLVAAAVDQGGVSEAADQIALCTEFGWTEAYLDMGWEEIKVAVEYDGDQHRTDRAQYVKDIRRLEMPERRGCVVISVIAEDQPDDVIRRVRDALSRRTLREKLGRNQLHAG